MLQADVHWHSPAGILVYGIPMHAMEQERVASETQGLLAPIDLSLQRSIERDDHLFEGREEQNHECILCRAVDSHP
jgi:hypothetical protein